jgi:hypothetical protein
MSRLTLDSKIKIDKKEMTVEEILKTIIYLPAAQVNSFFKELGLTIPRELRINVLKEILQERVVETRKSRLTLADEINYRLSWFDQFSETQLENLLIFYDDADLYKQFLELFWTDLLAYFLKKGVSSKDLKKFVEGSVAHVRAVGLDLPKMKSFNREIKDLFFDRSGKIDGLTPEKIRPVLYKSSTLHEIRDLGSKYDVDVPRRLKKAELADIIIKELKDRDQWSESLEQKIRSMSVLVMQRYAKDHNIKASTELKKEEIIEYILSNAKETKEAYFTPTSQAAYEKEVEQIKEVEEVVEEAVVEDIIEEIDVPLETQTEEVNIVQQVVDTKEIVLEIRKLREAVESFLQPDFSEVETSVETKSKGEDKELVVINSAEFYGKAKQYKKIVKRSEAEEREAFIESQKAGATEDGESKPSRSPRELRWLGRFMSWLGKGLLKFLWKLFKILLILLPIFIILLFIYAMFSKGLADTGMLQSVDNALNNIRFGGKGLLEHIYDILASIGL